MPSPRRSRTSNQCSKQAVGYGCGLTPGQRVVPAWHSSGGTCAAGLHNAPIASFAEAAVDLARRLALPHFRLRRLQERAILALHHKATRQALPRVNAAVPSHKAPCTYGNTDGKQDDQRQSGQQSWGSARQPGHTDRRLPACSYREGEAQGAAAAAAHPKVFFGIRAALQLQLQAVQKLSEGPELLVLRPAVGLPL